MVLDASSTIKQLVPDIEQIVLAYWKGRADSHCGPSRMNVAAIFCRKSA